MKTIGIIGAMPSELADIRAFLGDGKIEKYASYDFYVNELDSKKIVNVCCGVAKVNSAIATQILIDKFGVECVINTGIAGGMDSSVGVCDIVVANEVMHHDVTTRFLENYPPYRGDYEADKSLIMLAVLACESCGYKSFIGRIVSGEQFISDSNIKKSIVDEFNPFAVDMESAAIGHCCYRNNIPFATIRCISDNADDEGEMSFEEFEKIAAK
ncbi:MAG: 5'-methylthioadenosine/adenosylhomocysteine nucleosidase, partial [Oscillospiraceae bacterium]